MMRRVLSSAMLLLILAGAGCNNLWIDPMKQQPKFKAYSQNPMYKDGRAMRVPVGGTYSREMSYDDPALSGGDPDAGVFLDHIPLTVDTALLERGRDRFEINCLPCHGALGDGDSIVARKMLLRSPPSLLTDDIRALPDGKIETVIRVGYGLMNSYQDQLTSRDRWAVVAYVRALETSQRAPMDDAPVSERQKLMTERAQ
jgi:mono/diheme cytochrome c family protein